MSRRVILIAEQSDIEKFPRHFRLSGMQDVEEIGQNMQGASDMGHERLPQRMKQLLSNAGP